MRISVYHLCTPNWISTKGYKFLGDILRKCLFNGSPPEKLVIKSYLRERLLDPIRQVHRQRLYRQPPAAALFHVNARIMLQELVSSESEW